MGNNSFECSAVMNGCEIEITNYCGLDCYGCIRKESSSFGFLSPDTLSKILNYIKTKNYGEIVLSGLGDVFLHKELYHLIDMIFDAYPDMNIYIMTKAQSIIANDIDKIKAYNANGKNISLTFSIFSLKNKEYNTITGGGDLQHLMSMIKYAYKQRVHFNFEFFIDINNIVYIPNFKKFSKLFGKNFHYTIPHNWGGSLGTNKYTQIFDTQILSDYVSQRKPGDICEAFSGDYLFFDYSGSIYKCGLKRNTQDLYLGNILIPEDIKDLSMLDYSSCKSCSYYLYKTKLG